MKMKLLALALVLSLGASGAFATVLAPGSTVGPPLTDFTAGGINGAIVATATGSGTAGTLSGTFKLAVMTDAITGNLDFLYQFTTAAGSSAVEHITGVSFGGNTTDVGYETTNAADILLFSAPTLVSGGPLAPATADRSSDGAVVSFDWVGAAAFAGESDVLVIRTGAKTYVPGFANAIDGGTVTINGFAPAPEPSNVGLLLSGLFAVALFVTRRFRAVQS